MEILTAKAQGVLRITLNRPAKKNSLTAAMYQALADAFKAARADAAIKVVLITGGAELFTAGNDLRDFLDHPPGADDSPVFQFLAQISGCEKPIVAAVGGLAVGIGSTLLLHCDLVYAAENTRFSLPFTALGLVPEAASSYLLPRMAGHQQAAELLLLGEPFAAVRAKEIGLVTQVVSAQDLLATAELAVARLVALPAKSVMATKALMKSVQQPMVERQMKAEADMFRSMLAEPAAREAFNAFFEKRKPDFSNM
jgi:enoyl-CoA hydratase/carnithine racemase